MPDILIGEAPRAAPALSATTDMPQFETPAATPSPAPAAADTAADTKSGETTVTVDAETKSSDTAADTTATDTAGDTTETATETPPAEAKPDKKPGVQKRFGELTADRNAAEKRADALATSLEKSLAAVDTLTKALAAKPAEAAPKPAEAAPRPQREQFDSPDAYDTALIEWSTKQATELARAESKKEQLEADTKAKADAEKKAQETQLAQFQQTFQDTRAKAVEKYPDFAEVAESETLVISETMGFAIINHGQEGRDVQYFLGKNPEEAARIAALPAPAQVFEMGKIAARLAMPKSPPVSRTPAPVKPLGSSAAAVISDREPSMEEYAAARLPKLQAERRGVH